ADKAQVNAKDNDGLTPLHLAAVFGNKDVVELLLASKADVNAKANNGDTPLHFAAASGHKEVAELLLASKAEVNATDEDGDTPLHYAAFKGHKDVAELLLASKAEVNAKANNGNTPLHFATASGHKEVGELLRQHGGQDVSTPTQPAPSTSAQGQGVPTTKENVQQVQRRLQVLGYDSGSADGVMGSRTITALKAFQSQHSLPATGALNQETLEALGVEHETKSAPVAHSQHSREPQSVGRDAVTTAREATPASVPSGSDLEEKYERLDSDELHLQFEPAISSLQQEGRGLDVPGFNVVRVDGVVKKLAVGNTDIELATDRIGADQGFLTVATRSYGTIRFELFGNGLRVWLKPSQKKALLELLK
ncbi:MAG: ankyrin repeat domain-containing protein, partial [Candidatus Acidiferrum sp.]